jgi:four helix bundle protein
LQWDSASELDYHLLLCRDFKFLTNEIYDRTSKELIRVRKMLSALLARGETQMQAKAFSANG